jgi:hypothetical protein
MVPKCSLKSSQFEIQIFWTTLDGKTTKSKVIDLKDLEKLIVDNFFIWNHLFKENFVWISHFIKIQNFQTASDGETIQTKVVVLNNI